MHMLTKLVILVKARFANACPTVCFVRMLKKEKAVIHSSMPHSQASSILLTNPTNHNKVCHLYRLFFSRELHLFRRYSIQLNTRAPCQTFERNQIVQRATCHLQSKYSTAESSVWYGRSTNTVPHSIPEIQSYQFREAVENSQELYLEWSSQISYYSPSTGRWLLSLTSIERFLNRKITQSHDTLRHLSNWWIWIELLGRPSRTALQPKG